jgi:molybdenum transport protein
MDAGADVIQLEKCSPDVVAQVVARAGTRHCQIAVAGGVRRQCPGLCRNRGADPGEQRPVSGGAADVAVTVEAASG